MIKTIAATTILVSAFVPHVDDFDEYDEFDEAEVFVEINATDGDAGFQGIIDGDPWRFIQLDGADGKALFKFSVHRAARTQGMTEFQWESAEPTFDEVSLAEFLNRFPEGDYTFRARTIEGGALKSVAELTHHLPDGPAITAPEEDEVVDPDEDMLVTWDAVTTQFSEAGVGTGPPLDSPIVKYSVTVESDDEGDDKVMNVDVLEGTSATVPASFLDEDRHWKVEIGAFEESGNSTFRELPFCTYDEEECPEEEE